MTYEQIEAFMAIVKTGSMTDAANYLFISQPALSHRIKELEKELGNTLITRSKGIRSTELTPFGKRFLYQAEKWNQLWLETANLMSLNREHSIIISTVPSLGITLIPPIWEYFKKNHPEIYIELKMCDFSDAYPKLATGELDFSFIFYPVYHKDVQTIPLAMESLTFVCTPDSHYSPQVTIDQLDRSEEVFLPLSPDFEHWHAHWFKTNVNPLISTSQFMLAEYFIQHFNAWSIFPESMVNLKKKHRILRSCELTPNPPHRIIYLAFNPTLNHPLTDFIMEAVHFSIESNKSFTPLDKKNIIPWGSSEL